MIKELIKPILTERIRICDELQDNWGDGIEKCWKKEIEILTNNLTESVHYFLSECSDGVYEKKSVNLIAFYGNIKLIIGGDFLWAERKENH